MTEGQHMTFGHCELVQPKPVEVIQVIKTTLKHRGTGKEDNPYRVVTQYWLPDGTLLCEVDPERQANARSENPHRPIAEAK